MLKKGFPCHHLKRWSRMQKNHCRKNLIILPMIKEIKNIIDFRLGFNLVFLPFTKITAGIKLRIQKTDTISKRGIRHLQQLPLLLLLCLHLHLHLHPPAYFHHQKYRMMTTISIYFLQTTNLRATTNLH